MATAAELESRPPLTVTQFEALAQYEAWEEDIRVELLDGEPITSSSAMPHAWNATMSNGSSNWAIP